MADSLLIAKTASAERPGTAPSMRTPLLPLIARACAATLMLALMAPRLKAQDAPFSRRPELVIAGPSTVGLRFPLTSRLALRPDFAMTRTTFNVSGSETKFVTLGVGLGLLIGLGERDGVRTYVTPRVALARSTYDDGSFTDLWFFDAAFGASAPISKRLALFGEVGPRVTYSDQSTTAVTNRTTNLVARSALGATFAF